jgi:hypothetical protein
MTRIARENFPGNSPIHTVGLANLSQGKNSMDMKWSAALKWLGLVTFLFAGGNFCRAELPPLDEKALQKWWQEQETPDSWQAAVPEISDRLMEEYRAKGKSVFTNGTPFRQWFAHFQWLKLYPESKDSEAFRNTFKELGSRPEIKSGFINALHPQDQSGEALGILIDIAQHAPDDMDSYARLAIAFAIVFDSPFPRNWPHHQVSSAAVPTGKETVLERFDFFVQADKEGDMEYDLDELPVHLLKFIVDSKLDLSELKWVMEETDFDLRNIDEAFGSIRYDTPRANQDIFTWPHPSYSLKAIREKGGICVDQAYFASQTGKALGIPTLYFSGQGSGGGHAWFGYLEDEDEWRTDVGQYETQNYPVGNARDPQTWQTINDAELAMLSEGLENEPGYQPSRQALRFADFQRDQPECAALLDDARSWMPELIEPWRAKADFLAGKVWLPEWMGNQVFLRRTPQTDPPQKTDELKSHLLAWIEQFDDQTDLKVEGQSRLLEIYKAENHPETESLQKEIVRQNRKKRFDLGIASGVAPVLEHLDAGNWDEAEKEYKRLIRKFDEQGGGNLFYIVVRPYFLTCLEENKLEYAEEALEYAEKKMEPKYGSILDGELKKLYSRLEELEP